MARIKIVLHVNPQGQVVLRTHGVKGPGCRQVARFLRDTLGEVLSEERTEEFYQRPGQMLSESAEQDLSQGDG